MAGRGRTKRRAATIDEYLAHVPRDQRAALERLRRAIHAIALASKSASATRCRHFAWRDGWWGGLGASATHCAYYPMSGSVVKTLKHELRNYDISKGTIRFQPNKPLPIALIRKLLRARIEELERKRQSLRTVRSIEPSRAGSPQRRSG